MASTPPIDLDRDALENLVKNAGKLLLVYFGVRGHLHVVEKDGASDYVTNADKAVQEEIFKGLEEMFPEHRRTGEEILHEGDSNVYTPPDSPNGFTWVVDPVDGTYNLTRGIADFAVTIGLLQGGWPTFGIIYLPVTDELFSGGTHWVPRLNGSPLNSLEAYNSHDAFAGIGLGERTPKPERSQFLAALDEEKVKFRRIGSASVSFVQVMLGNTDGYVSLSERLWGIVGGIAILNAMGAVGTFDWERGNFNGRLRLAVGKRGFIEDKVRDGGRLAACLEQSTVEMYRGSR